MLLPWSILAFLPMICSALSSADYYVRSLPGLSWNDNTLKMHAGHIVLDAEHHGEMFFWHVQRKHLSGRQRTVIWLNGGPGCSSMDGLFLEIGPFRLQDADTLVPNDGSWHEYANLLFVDNPLGTGFSFVDSDSYISELDEMTRQFMRFMDKFIDLFPEYAQDDIYLAGESFAGQYIPYIGAAMAETLKQNTHQHKRYNIKGLLIGNGWIDPMSGYKSYLPFAIQSGLVQEGSQQYKALNEVVQQCIASEREHGTSIHMPVCEGIMNKLFEVTLTQDSQGTNLCINAYDYTLQDTYPSCGMNWPSELTFMNPYLRKQEVLEAIHATDRKLGWAECDGTVGATFKTRTSKPSSKLFPQLLEDIPILLYSGANDVICNHLSTEYFVNDLIWNGKQGFANEPEQAWVVDQQDVGHYLTARNLTYVKIYNASHMVPYDKPKVTRDMLDRFMGLEDSALIGSLSGSMEPAGAPTRVVTAEEQTTPSRPEVTSPSSSPAVDKNLLAKLKKLQEYYHAGSVALVVVILALGGLIWFIYKHRGHLRRRYGFDKLGLQEAGRVDDAELEELTLRTPLFDANDTFDIDTDEEDEPAQARKPLNRQPSSRPHSNTRSHRD